MPKQKVLKNRNEEQVEQPQQKQHVEEEQKQSTSRNELQLQQPPKKITHTVKKGGQPREYHYLTTVKSSEELDKLRFQNYCSCIDSRRKHNFTTITMPCTRNSSGKDCDFELRALRSSDGRDIYVYAYSQHNHSFQSDERRLSTVEKELVPDGNPPQIFCSLDKIQWRFLETLPDYGKVHKFRRKNNCNCRNITSDRSTRIRGYCANRLTQSQCQFMLLIIKTTKQRYHVYSNGEHNHTVHNIKRRGKSPHGKQKNRQKQMEDAVEEGEVPMEEEQENEPVGQEQNAEDIAQPEQDEQMETEDRQYPLEKCQRRLQKNLRKDNKERTKKWMGRIDRADIGQVITEMDVENVANLMRIADIDICNGEASLEFWLPWIKKAIRKRRAELVEFIMEFKHLRRIESLPKKLKAKIRKMLHQRRATVGN